MPMPKIVISYRREDTAGVTGRIFDRLKDHFGKESIFRDIDDIPVGTDFRTYVDRALSDADVFLCIMGEKWLGKRKRGQSRIQDPADFVRIEVETAMRRAIPVIPVLIDKTQMPGEADLPASLQDFRYRHAVNVDQLSDFDVHASRLLRSIDRILTTPVAEATPAAPQGPPREPELQPAPPPTPPVRPTPTPEPQAAPAAHPQAPEVRAARLHRAILLIATLIVTLVVIDLGRPFFYPTPSRIFRYLFDPSILFPYTLVYLFAPVSVLLLARKWPSLAKYAAAINAIAICIMVAAGYVNLAVALTFYQSDVQLLMAVLLFVFAVQLHFHARALKKASPL
jgi:hypothetical protein